MVIFYFFYLFFFLGGERECLDRSWGSLSFSVVGDHASCAGSQVLISLCHCISGETPPVSTFSGVVAPWTTPDLFVKELIFVLILCKCFSPQTSYKSNKRIWNHGT